MDKKRRLISVFIGIVLFTYACKPEPERSFYYWKSVFHLSQPEREYLKDLYIRKLYIRFFDVDWDESSGMAIPLAKVRFAESIPPGIKIVPVVYITNKTLQKTRDEDISSLALKALNEVDKIASDNNFLWDELQVDCDWTKTTRGRYFKMLEVLKAGLRKRNIEISATIRLHQVKYKDITGIPPVDRGMLMYYNMGRINAGDSPNSVFNTADAAKYIDFLPDYPLPLDIALPAFSWGIHIRNGSVIGLLNNMNLSDFQDSSFFTNANTNSFTATGSFFFRGFYFMKNDVVKVEEITPEQCLLAAKQVNTVFPGSPGSVAIFHLDSLIISHYEKKDFEKAFNTYR